MDKEADDFPLSTKLEKMQKKQPTSRVSFTKDSIGFKVYIDEILHLYIIGENFNGFQSYKIKDSYYIEVCLNGTTMVLTYSTRQIWEEVLHTLNKHL